MKVKFTPAWVRNAPLPTTKDRQHYQDSTCAGLSLIAHRSGERFFWALLWQKASRRRKWEKIGPVTSIALDDARKKVAQLRGEMAGGKDLFIEADVAHDMPTVGQLFDEWFGMRAARGDRTVAGDRDMAQRWFLELPDAPPKKHGRRRFKPKEAENWSALPCNHITVERCEDLAGAMGAHRRRSGIVLSLIRAAFEWGITKRKPRIKMPNPAYAVTAAKSTQRKRFARSGELPDLLAAIAKQPQPWRDLFAVLLFVGFRRGAVQKMRRDEIDIAARQWHVPKTSSKNKDEVLLSLQGQAWTVIKRRYDSGGEWIFPGATKAGHIGRPKRAWDAMLKTAGLKDFRPHDLRHTVGAHLGAQGASQATIAKTLGHRDIRSAAIYTHIDHEPVRRELREVHRVFDAAAKRRRK